MVLLITCNIFDLPKFQNRSVGELAYRGVFFFDIDTTPSDLHYGTCKAIFANEIDRTSEDPEHTLETLDIEGTLESFGVSSVVIGENAASSFKRSMLGDAWVF